MEAWEDQWDYLPLRTDPGEYGIPGVEFPVGLTHTIMKVAMRNCTGLTLSVRVSGRRRVSRNSSRPLMDDSGRVQECPRKSQVPDGMVKGMRRTWGVWRSLDGLKTEIPAGFLELFPLLGHPRLRYHGRNTRK